MNRDGGLRMGSLLSSFLVLAGATLTSAQQVPNADFTQGADHPSGWKLSGGTGRWVDRQWLEVTGNGEESNQWQTEVNFTPGGLYHFQMRVRRPSGSGAAVAGPEFSNHDFAVIAKDWRWRGFVCRVPANVSRSLVRLGQWRAKGTIQFDAVQLTPVVPIHSQFGNLVLGDGESISEGCYEFRGWYERFGGNDHRTLEGTTAWFNTNRWCFGPGAQVTYRFGLPSHRFTGAEINFAISYYNAGECTAEVSCDGGAWRTLATQKGLGQCRASLPADLLPAASVLVRLRASGGGTYFQVDNIDFRGQLTDPPGNATGRTIYAEQEGTSHELQMAMAIQESMTSEMKLLVSLRNTSGQSVDVKLGGSVEAPDGGKSDLATQTRTVAASATAEIAVPMPTGKPGEHRVKLSLNPAGGQALVTSFKFNVSDYLRTDYGQLLSPTNGGVCVWWCDATHKVPRERPAPSETGTAAAMGAARNDREAVQVVVRAGQPLKGLRATCSALKTANGGATIASDQIKILRAYYHFVDHPTDTTSIRGWWPDALPPLDKPLDVPAGSNQPLWILVHVPQDAAAGDYAGQLKLEAEGWSTTVPIRLHVWNFALPEKNHLETAFGFSAGEAFWYHQVKTDADKRKLLDLYFQSFAEHRISPYDPTPLDPIQVKFVPDANPVRTEVDFRAFDRAMADAVERYHFTNFRLNLQGMGGGTFHERFEPSIGKFGESTPQYQAMFAGQLKQLEEHLRAKGWLGMAYVYWFDEPDPKDYEFVRKGMERIKRYAPGIQTMLTEEAEEALAGPIDIWCPVTPNYDHAAAERMRARGNRFWWYVCTGPKAPYCTLFIDHPATDLRVWHWQTWQRGIVGTLVWESNYWTSPTAFPDKPQNPYEDPMGYVTGYSTPKGKKQYWGNGDGRFIYPPLAAAVPGAPGSKPVLEPPVASIRWEMLREGVEDYEFLYLLRERLEKNRDKLTAEQARQFEALLSVPESITKDMTTFTTDPTPIYLRRAAIADAIERLAR